MAKRVWFRDLSAGCARWGSTGRHSVAEGLEARRLLAASPAPLTPDDAMAGPQLSAAHAGSPTTWSGCGGTGPTCRRARAVDPAAGPAGRRRRRRRVRGGRSGRSGTAAAVTAADAASAASAVTVEARLDAANLAVIDAAQLTHAQLLHSFRSLPGFRYLEPDFVGSLDAVPEPSDPRFAQMSALHNTGQTGGTAGADIDAPAAWAALGPPTGDPVVVGVVDSGVVYTHPDLAPSMWHNPGEIPGDGLDNDNNGVADDVFGADFLIGDGDPMDTKVGHGTHVAGTIAAAFNNGQGVAGVAPGGQIMALRMSDDSFLSVAAAVRALDYAVMMRRRGVNLRVINGSWHTEEPSAALRDVIDAAGREGILYVASAQTTAR